MEVVFVILGILVLIFLYMKWMEHKNTKLFIEKCKEKYGQRPTREYSYEEFERISHYFLHHKKNNYVVDDITWNDLDMDTIFLLLNHTNSSIGESYLYHMLRTPLFSKDVLEERKRLKEYFTSEEETRLRFQTLYGKLGRLRDTSIDNSIHRMKELELPSALQHYLCIVFVVVSISFFLLMPQAGVLALIGMLAYNIISYYRYKAKMDSYMSTVSYLIRLLNAAKEYQKINDPALEVYNKKIEAALKQCLPIKRRAPFITSGKIKTGSIEEVILDYVRMITHMDLIFFERIIREIKKNEAEIDTIYETLGMTEAMIAVASAEQMLPYCCIPELLSNREITLKSEEIYHPMINDPVSNGFSMQKNVLLTGSNASGKSTFLKTVAINAVLAQSIYLVAAKQYQANFFRIFSSMALNDNLESKESYFIVEIKSLKRILDQVNDEAPILCFVDEVLRGTNTVERIAASAEILKSLYQKNVMCFAATHDIELTYILEAYYENYHFEEEVIENDVLFSYQLKTGRAKSRNAIKLLQLIGYDREIVEQAQEQAEDFMKNNSWRKL